MDYDEAAETLRKLIRDVLATDFKELSKEDLAAREAEVFRKARNLLTRVELEVRELEVRKMEVEQHMRALRAIVSANSLAGRIDDEGASPSSGLDDVHKAPR